MSSGLTCPSPALTEESALLAHVQGDIESGTYGHPQSEGGKKPRDALKPLVQGTKWAKARYYLPFLAWMPNYRLSMVPGDFLAGLSVACILVPQSISYATSLAKLSPHAGLFAAAIPGIVYALLGTSRQLNVAPEAALSLLVGQAVAAAQHGGAHDPPYHPDVIAVAVSTITTFQVGAFAFLLGLFRLGFIDVLLSRALLKGFMAAIAVVIMIEQLIPMLGLVELEKIADPETTLEKLIFLIRNAATHEHRPTTLVSFGSLIVLILLRWIKNSCKKYWFIYRVPEVLVVVVLTTVLSDIFDWDEYGISILGAVPIKASDAFIKFPIRKSTMQYFQDTTSTAILITVIGYLDSVVAAKQNAQRFGYSISPNRELVALGSSNIVASFFPGLLPAYGSITRSRINADVGGRSQMASLFCSALVLISTFFLIPSLYYLPRCVLASIVTLIVFNLITEVPHDLLYYWRMQAWTDLGLVAITFICTILWNVEVGVVVSIICSLLLVVHKSSKPRLLILGRIPGTNRWKSVNENPEAEEDVSGVLIVRLRDSLDFANAAQLKERLRRLELYGETPSHPSEAPRRDQASVVVFHLGDLDTCDASAAQIFYELLEHYKTRGTAVFLTHLRDAPREKFARAGIVDLIGEDSIYEDVSSAIQRIEMVELANTVDRIQ